MKRPRDESEESEPQEQEQARSEESPKCLGALAASSVSDGMFRRLAGWGDDAAVGGLIKIFDKEAGIFLLNQDLDAGNKYTLCFTGFTKAPGRDGEGMYQEGHCAHTQFALGIIPKDKLWVSVRAGEEILEADNRYPDMFGFEWFTSRPNAGNMMAALMAARGDISAIFKQSFFSYAAGERKELARFGSFGKAYPSDKELELEVDLTNAVGSVKLRCGSHVEELLGEVPSSVGSKFAVVVIMKGWPDNNAVALFDELHGN